MKNLTQSTMVLPSQLRLGILSCVGRPVHPLAAVRPDDLRATGLRYGVLEAITFDPRRIPIRVMLRGRDGCRYSYFGNYRRHWTIDPMKVHGYIVAA